MKKIDLHTHSTFSDGSLTPTEVIVHAKQSGLSAVALSDHDSISGLEEAALAAAECGIEFVSGIELAAKYKDIEIHILGLKILNGTTPLSEALPNIMQVRHERNLKMIKLLNEAGARITLENLQQDNKHSTITRAHFAKALAETGFCSTRQEAFSKYLSPGCPTYIRRNYLGAEESIALIKNSGGIPILAHATLYKLDFVGIENMVKSLTDYGLMGLECYYSSYSEPEHQFMMKLAKKYRLHKSGGSDFHGSNKPHIGIGSGRGNLFVPYSLWEDLKKL